ncbi:MAG: glutamate formiminotransferase, partial [bacterium]|nr:glutamate formiminotransferase [bacterium]
EASSNPSRKTLPQIRESEYEGLARKMELKEWRPDFGPEEFNPRSGATVIGARKFLIAFNVNLKSLNLAKEIAGKIRESGVKKEIGGQEIRIPGEFKELKALGIELKERSLAQVSMNLTDYKITGMRAVFERIKELAREKGIEIASGEIVGLLPLEAILESGRFYASGSDSEEDLIKAAIKNLKLDKFSDFDPLKKIIEYMI